MLKTLSFSIWQLFQIQDPEMDQKTYSTLDHIDINVKLHCDYLLIKQNYKNYLHLKVNYIQIVIKVCSFITMFVQRVVNDELYIER